MKFLSSGKVKDIFLAEDDTLVFKFSDRVSAFDVKFTENIPKKGEILCKFAEFWFNKLDMPNHFVKRISENEIIVHRLKMLPIECVVRGYFYGSLVDRWKKGEMNLPAGSDPVLATRLTEPIFDPTTKSEHDEPITKMKALKMKLVDENQFELLKKMSIEIYKKMYTVCEKKGFILADLKLEFGIFNGEIVLGDSIGPDECRMWLKDSVVVGKKQEAFDKQILRDWLTENGYLKKFNYAREKGKEPSPPSIPSEIIKKMTNRYVVVYEKITGNTI